MYFQNCKAAGNRALHIMSNYCLTDGMSKHVYVTLTYDIFELMLN